MYSGSLLNVVSYLQSSRSSTIDIVAKKVLVQGGDLRLPSRVLVESNWHSQVQPY